jgi:hypothetical protein
MGIGLRLGIGIKDEFWNFIIKNGDFTVGMVVNQFIFFTVC